MPRNGSPVTAIFDRPPSALRFMLNALRPSPGLRGWQTPPAITARWYPHVADRKLLDSFARATGLQAGPHLPIVYPYVFGFRLPMVILTLPAFPLPIWRALQIRAQITQYRPLPSSRALSIETSVADLRILSKGAEFDLRTLVMVDGKASWEGLNTFYYRGRFSEPAADPPDSRSPQPPATITAQWQMKAGAGACFARMTGDYNGVHRWSWYARRLGFDRAFFHPQLVAAQCLSRLCGPDIVAPQRLDLWVKGPVYFDANVTLAAERSETETIFALMVDHDARPALVGRWRAPG